MVHAMSWFVQVGQFSTVGSSLIEEVGYKTILLGAYSLDKGETTHAGIQQLVQPEEQLRSMATHP